MRQRKNLEIDGTMEVPAQEMMTFPYRLAKSGDYNTLTIFIPRQIKEALQLTANSLVQVAIKTITEQECKEIFIGVPNPKGTKAEPVRWNTRQYVRQCRGEMMNCPVCQKSGTLQRHIGQRKRRIKNKIYECSVQYIYVYHGASRERHYISRKRFPEFFNEHIQKKGEKQQ